MSTSLNIHVIENGPLKLSAESVSLRYCGQQIELEPGSDVFLCRCGESKNAPFCDGSHNATGFDGSGKEGEGRPVRVWEGNTIRTYFNPNACMHVFYCKPLKELRERELAGDAAAAEEIARVVQTCPSGALTFESKTVECEETPSHADVEIVEGGEIRIQCAFDINAALHERQPNDRATLCRCGLSANKPWCDGRHKKRDGFR